MVEDDDAQGAGGSFGEQLGSALQLCRADAAGLVPPGANRVETDDEEPVAAVDGLGRLPLALELAKRSREAAAEGPRDVVIAWDDEQWALEPAQKGRRSLVLVPAPAMRQIAAGDDQFRLDALDQRAESALDFWLLDGADMQVREVKEPRWHRRSRLVH
jgi:hypothetical protein